MSSVAYESFCRICVIDQSYENYLCPGSHFTYLSRDLNSVQVRKPDVQKYEIGAQSRSFFNRRQSRACLTDDKQVHLTIQLLANLSSPLLDIINDKNTSHVLGRAL